MDPKYIFYILYTLIILSFILLRKQRSIFFAHQVSWGGAFVLALTDDRVVFQSYFIFWIAISLIVYQLLFFYWISFNKISDKNELIIDRSFAQLIKIKKILKLSLFISFAILGSKLLSSVGQVGFTNTARSLELSFGSQPLINAFIFLLIPLSFFLMMSIKAGISRIFYCAALLISGLFIYMLGVKGNVYLFLLILFFTNFYTEKKFFWYTPIFVFLAILIFLYMMASRYGIDLNYEQMEYLIGRLTGYVSFNFSNLQDYVTSKKEFSYGLGILFAIPCLLVKGTHWCIDDAFGVDRSKPYDLYVSPNFNIETGYGKLFVDFAEGVFLILPILLFLLHSFLYKRKTKTLRMFGIYVCISSATVLLFFDMRLIHPVTLFTIMIIIFFGIKIIRGGTNN